MLRVCVAAALLAGCGRLGFTERAGDDADGASGRGDTSAGDDSSSLRCDQKPGVLFCDGFEGPNLDGWTDAYGALVRQTAIVHTGTAAARATSDGSQQAAGVGVAPYNGLSTGSLHYRAWFYVPSGFAITKINLFTTYGNTGNDEVVFLVDQEELRVYSARGPRTITSGTTMPRDRWFCIEVHIDIAASNGTVRLDLDGTTIGSGSGFSTLPAGGYTFLGVGTLFLPVGQGASTIYIDDVATGTQPLGCS
jgi:hypothetical protein